MGNPSSSRVSIRAIASIAMLISLIFLVPSGIALHLRHGTHSRFVFMAIHNACSLVFITAAAAHIILNIRAIKSYAVTRSREVFAFKKEFIIAVIIAGGIMALALVHVLGSHGR